MCFLKKSQFLITFFAADVSQLPYELSFHLKISYNFQSNNKEKIFKFFAVGQVQNIWKLLFTKISFVVVLNL